MSRYEKLGLKTCCPQSGRGIRDRYTIAQIGYLFVNGAIILPVAIGLLSIGPRYLPAAEVSMFTVLEVILAPFLVWLVLGENPGGQSLIGGAIIISAIFAHTLGRLRKEQNKEL